MKSLVATILAMAASVPASSGLPLRAGTYVQADTTCKDAPFAAMMMVDSKGLSDPHSAQCRSRILRRTGKRYLVKTVCSANGDGSPAKPTSETATLLIPSSTSFFYSNAGATHKGPAYRLCPPEHPQK